MDQEVYQRILDFCSENEEEEGKTRNATNPARQFVKQQLIEFIWNFEGKRIYLVHDGSGEFRYLNYDDFGIEGIKISANAPNMKAFSERFIGSVRREAFD